MSNICEGSAKFGKPVDLTPQWLDKVKATGFVEVEQKIYKCFLIEEQQAVDSYTPGIFSRIRGWSQEEIQVHIARVKNDIENPAIHLYMPVYFIWGKKPEA
ncbi:conserved hypothetical protein [Verticillium alfalfae VaMs.102]|uniref:Methyltransferase n=1 Tax=Verticillium alfalfae (strain VaMs.102 / ATCC MYA-4576 / FGSC 10136) TaxID=526221 RepID=C9SY74_VERA1|nr:conserved hypothetical protein [Verticillium alfalfae VaMs.102]EEY23739.1 conserved hypothetical protein [Verticillium alfalfae VaMs.102]